MSEIFSKQQIDRLIAELNSKLNCSVNPEDYKNHQYSTSSLKDLLVQRYSDELSGEWTTERALKVLHAAWVKMKNSPQELHADTVLANLIAPSERRKIVAIWSETSGLELDVLRPNSVLNGLLIFLFFAFIPLGIGMDWFISGIGMSGCALGIYILGKTARNFKMETFGQMAESIAWKMYLKQQKNPIPAPIQRIEEEVRNTLNAI
jgi:hypothetical protein